MNFAFRIMSFWGCPLYRGRGSYCRGLPHPDRRQELVADPPSVWEKVLYPYRADRFTGWVIRSGFGPVNYQTWFKLRAN